MSVSTWYQNAHDMNSFNIFQAPHEWKQCVSLSRAFKWRVPHAILDLGRLLNLGPFSAGDLGSRASRTTIPVETSCNLSGFDPIELWTFMASLLPAPVATVCSANDPRLWHPRVVRCELEWDRENTSQVLMDHTLKHDNLNVYLPLTLPTDAGNTVIPSGIFLQSQRNITTLSSFVCTAHWQLIALLTSQTYAYTTELWSRILDRYCHVGSTSSLEFPNHRHEFIQAHCQSGDLLLRVLSNAWNMSET
ncbi:hypothetical protein AC1031_008580 [Aphanomyces cochlioides]|nr:hypothetical protein AC1031_008580 [Aphanomyces cochlioides]